jgi:hypothetical protein
VLFSIPPVFFLIFLCPKHLLPTPIVKGDFLLFASVTDRAIVARTIAVLIGITVANLAQIATIQMNHFIHCLFPRFLYLLYYICGGLSSPFLKNGIFFVGFHKHHQGVIIVFGILHALTQFGKLNNDRMLKAIDSNHAVNQVLSHGVYLSSFCTFIIAPLIPAVKGFFTHFFIYLPHLSSRLLFVVADAVQPRVLAIKMPRELILIGQLYLFIFSTHWVSSPFS